MQSPILDTAKHGQDTVTSESRTIMRIFKTLLILFMVLQANQALASFESTLFTRHYETYSSMDEAKKAAGPSNKGIFVYYTRAKCPPCDYLRGAILWKNEVASVISRGFVFTAVWGSSMGHAERQFYRETYGDFGAPTFLLFNSKGEYVCTSRGGFRDAEHAIKLTQSLRTLISEGRDKPASSPTDCNIVGQT